MVTSSLPELDRSDLAALERELLSEGELVVDRLDQWAVTRPQQTFVFYGEEDRSLSFAEFHQLRRRIAGALRSLGVGKGDRVGLFLRNPLVTSIAMFGLWRIGAAYCPINFNLRGSLLAHQLGALQAKLLITEESLLAILGDVLDDVGQLPLVVHRPRQSDHDFDSGSAGALAPRGREVASFADLLAAEADAPPSALDSGSIANIIYTSGTTGPSKGVVQSHRWMNQFIYTPRRLINQEDVLYNDLPLYHAAGAIVNMARAAWVGCEVALWDRFSSSAFWRRIASRGATGAVLLDVMIPRLLNAPPRADDHCNTLHLVNMVPLPEGHNAIACRFGFDICATSYGQTETGAGAFAFIDEMGDQEGTPASLYKGLAKEEVWRFARSHGYPVLRGTEEIRRGLMGRPSVFVEAAILGLDDEELGSEEYGQLAFRGRLPHLLMEEYFAQPEATRDAFRRSWFHTGDAAIRDAQGLYYFVDRMGSFIRRKGENISSYEVEALLSEHDDVAMSAVVGVPAREGDEEDVAAFVVAKPGRSLDAASFLEWTHKELPRYMWPEFVRVVDDLPRTPTNKVEKYRLRQGLIEEMGIES